MERNTKKLLQALSIGLAVGIGKAFGAFLGAQLLIPLMALFMQ